MLMGNPPPHWPRWQFQPRLEPVLSTWGLPSGAWGKIGRLPQIPQASPMSSTCREVILDQVGGMGPTRDDDPAAITGCQEDVKRLMFGVALKAIHSI